MHSWVIFPKRTTPVKSSWQVKYNFMYGGLQSNRISKTSMINLREKYHIGGTVLKSNRNTR